MDKPKRGIIMKRNDGSEVVNYNIDSFPTYIHDGYIFPGCTWERVPHYHDDVEFISVYSMIYILLSRTVKKTTIKCLVSAKKKNSKNIEYNPLVCL